MEGYRILKGGGTGDQHANVVYACRQGPVSERFGAWIRNVGRQLEACETARGGSVRIEFPSFERTFTGCEDEKYQALQSDARMMYDDDLAIVESA